MIRLVLASSSPARRAMLAAAGVAHEAVSPGLDEAALKRDLAAAHAPPQAVARALAEAKAAAVSRRLPDALVLGADQVLTLADGEMFDKATGRAALEAQLRRLRGREHRLISAAAITESGRPVWRHSASATLEMRDFSDAFLATYLDAEGDTLLGCVGGYRIEGRGAQLFARIEGDHFTVQGLPLLAVLEHLRKRGVLCT